MHSILVVVFVQVVSSAVVVMVKRSGNAGLQFDKVGYPVAVPVVVSPVHNAVVVVVPSGLLFAPETTREEFLVNVQASIVVVVGIFTIGNSVVVVVNVVEAWRSQALGHDALVPNCLVEAVIISVGIVSVVIVVIAI